MACPGQWGGGRKSESLFFVAFQYFKGEGGGAAQKIADNIIFATKKVAKYKYKK